MKFLDSNILAYAFYHNEHTEKCQKVIQEGGITDTFNLVEAFFIIEKEVNKERAEKCINGLLKSHIEIVDVDINIVFEAIRKIKKFPLSIFDMVHYMCALMHGCDAIVSYDKDFNKCDLKRIEP